VDRSLAEKAAGGSATREVTLASLSRALRVVDEVELVGGGFMYDFSEKGSAEKSEKTRAIGKRSPVV
jgi:hypothetical protein